MPNRAFCLLDFLFGARRSVGKHLLQVQPSVSLSSTQQQASLGLAPSMGTMGSGALGLPQGHSQTLRQTSLGSASRQASLGLQGQGSLGRAPGSALNGTQRQASSGLSPGMGQGNMGLPYEPSPQDLQVCQKLSSDHQSHLNNRLI